MNFHAVSHSFPHRGPGASRARTRWQPYASNVTLSAISRSPSVYLHTPASSVSSNSPQTIHLPPICDHERLKAPLQSTPIANPLRESQKAKYAAKLVDQAVKTLCETWHPEDIPTVFTACTREALCAQPDPPTSHSECATSPPLISTEFSTLFACRNTQLPSPVSPTSCQTPSPSGGGCESHSQAPEGSAGSNLIPIKGFVHEVLRRSRTSTGVLQTALCYLEAVRSKVPELLRTEKTRPTTERTEAPEPRIVQGVFEIEVHDNPTDSTIAFDQAAASTIQTVRIGDTVLVGDIDVEVPRSVMASSHSEDECSLPPLPALPSPLCCPRRTFLACLILASKFMQDRSYSNRAWAKLAGLPPREIGRCERALGDALEWRLWVGKIPVSSTPTSGMSSGRTVTRSRSDGDVVYASTRSCTTSSTAAWAAPPAAAAASSSVHSSLSLPPPVQPPRSWTRGVSRSATVPVIGASRSSTLVDPFFVLTSDGAGCSYETREAPGPGYDAISQMDVEPQGEVSPSLSTPSLSYSPMSSTSSSSDGSEDRTIQMSMFLDLPTPAMSTCGNNPGPWVASVFTYTPSDSANSCGSFGPINAYPSYFNPSNPTCAADMEATEASIGQMLPAFNSTGTKQVFNTLPSFAEVFSNPGMFENGTQ